jgi:hypothetical protein
MPSLLLTLQGRPYAAHVPDKLERAYTQFLATADSFRGLDARFLEATSPTGFAETLRLLDSSANLSGDGSRSATDPRPPLHRIVARLSSRARIGLSDLLEANGQLTGRARSKLRDRPVWMDATHPADSWFVAPPPGLLRDSLIDMCALAQDASLPVTLRASVSMLLMLQIHPFEDGNGRTARALYAALVRRGLGPAQEAISALAGIWAFRGMKLHSASLHLRDLGEWGPYLELCLEALHRSAGAKNCRL